jgi:hypothetical protein
VPATHEDIEQRAYYLWQERGCPPDSPEIDWRQAERELSGSSSPDGQQSEKDIRQKPGPLQRAEHNT